MNIKNRLDFNAAHTHDNDLKIIELCQAGNSDAFAYLVEKYKNMVYQLALRMTANYHDSEDIAQESFLKAYRSLHQYKPSYSFSSWLYQITLNTIRDRIRKQDLTASFSAQPENYQEAGSPLYPNSAELAEDPEERQIRKQNRFAMQSAINALSLSHREIIILRHIQNLSYYEISKILNITLNSVKVRLHRARVELKDMLQEQEQENKE
ncbi:MAG: sigma-70 family RNA polymerase sigma factor [Candidatus Atribacteria bacterium]|nr:sigma-70 family RNA polymerase sigma factor [Candidatus Atribacteria bacterium]